MNHPIAPAHSNELPAPEEACRTGGLERPIEIIEVINRVEYGPPDLQSSLSQAVRNGQLQIARDLLDHGAVVDNSVAYAAIHSSSDLIQVFELLLEKGWNVNSSVYRAKTALW